MSGCVSDTIPSSGPYAKYGELNLFLAVHCARRQADGLDKLEGMQGATGFCLLPHAPHAPMQESTLWSIEFTCVYLACKMVDRMPRLQMLQYMWVMGDQAEHVGGLAVHVGGLAVYVWCGGASGGIGSPVHKIRLEGLGCAVL